MSHVNSATISGNLTKDPELKMAGADGDFAIVNLRLANNRSRKQDDGSYADEVSYFDVTVFGKFAELVARKLRKADPLTVSGRLEQQRWTTDEGERSKVVLIAQGIDAQAFFKKDDEVSPLAESTPAAAAPADEAAADDDIPF